MSDQTERSTDKRKTPRNATAQPAASTSERTGAQVMCEALLRENVSVMFGIPGGCIMPFYHAMWEYRSRLRHVLCRHEQGAGHAAEGYARATGQVGVCIGTSGPGATNLVTPIADAWMDGTPLVAITGQVPSALLGTDAFQETDITGITVPITKHNFLVTRASELPRVFREAFHIARTGRPGPVLIDITMMHSLRASSRTGTSRWTCRGIARGRCEMTSTSARSARRPSCCRPQSVP